MRALIVSACLVVSVQARATPRLSTALGLASERGCGTCHNSDRGGSVGRPDLNPFGLAIQARLPGGWNSGDPIPSLWDSTIGALDHDGDGYSSAIELGDLDYDGVRDRSDWPVRSPGKSDGADGADLDECDLGLAPECPEYERCHDTTGLASERPTYECVCGSETTGRRDDSGMCVLLCEAGFERVDGVCVRACEEGFTRREGVCVRRFSPPRPRILPDGIWVTPVFEEAVGIVATTSCDPTGRYGGYAHYYEYPQDCPGGEVWVEADGRALLSVLDGSEIDCAITPARVRLADGARLRVVGGARVRATCVAGAVPGGRLESNEGPTCSTAAPITDGSYDIRFLTRNPGEWLPGEYDSCGHELYPDLWLEYTATCDGRLTLDLHEDGDWCREVSTRRLSVHTPADCPARQAPLLCESWSHLSPWEYGDCGEPEGIYTRLTVRHGEALLVRVSGYDSFATFADLDVRCTPGQVCDANTCALEATCTEIDQRVECECWEGWSGDGVPVARGGSGCTPPDDPSLCEQRGLECHPDASCGIRYESDEDYIQRLRDDPNSDPRRLQYPYCQCNEGWVGSGFECVPRNECSEGIHGCPFHSTCIDETPGFRCECDNGHFRNPYVDELECVVVCGDGRIGPGEECDDGNVRSGDGCDGFCAEEPTWRCYQNLGPASYCESTCDDDWIDPDDDLCGQDDNCNCSAPGAPGGSPWAYGGLFAVVFLLQRRR